MSQSHSGRPVGTAVATDIEIESCDDDEIQNSRYECELVITDCKYLLQALSIAQLNFLYFIGRHEF